MNPSIAIVDSGGANIGSIRYALDRLGLSSELTGDVTVIKRASRVILPGVGAAAAAMTTLERQDLIGCIGELDQPVLGICLGMQLLHEHSDEGGVDLLGLIPGRARLLERSPGIRVPHMGWNRINAIPDTDHHPAVSSLDGQFVYFVHSYAVEVNRQTVATTAHGSTFTAISQHHNFLGAQFHPERSGPAGLNFLKRFLA